MPPQFYAYSGSLLEGVKKDMSDATRYKRVILVLCAVILGFSLGACRNEEQDRITEFKQGTYLGKTDQALSDKTVGELRMRARGQGS